MDDDMNDTTKTGEVREHDAEPPQVPFNPGAVHWGSGASVPSRMARGILMELAAHCDKYGCTIVSQRRLAERTMLSDRTVRKHLKILEAMGLLRRVTRATRHGGRTSDLTQLIAWPGRQRLPNTGHPRWGRRIVETLFSVLAHMDATAARRKQVPSRAEAASDKEQLYKNQTTYDTAADAALDRALNALGACATAENRRHLTADRATLLGWLRLGLDVERDLVPILNEHAQRGHTDKVLRTWEYFNHAVEPLLERRSANRTPRSAPPDAMGGQPPAEHPRREPVARFGVGNAVLRGLAKAPADRRHYRDDDE